VTPAGTFQPMPIGTHSLLDTVAGSAACHLPDCRLRLQCEPTVVRQFGVHAQHDEQWETWNRINGMAQVLGGMLKKSDATTAGGPHG
jgi:hypothetical protein